MRPEHIVSVVILALVLLGGAWLLSTGGGVVPETVRPEGTPYVEIVNPSGFVNTEGVTLGELAGKKVILVEFLTYSCINCQRTFPYVVSWYSKYKDEGLEIIGIHTPEFAFEKDIDNVRKAMKEFGIEYPIVLDNDYATWNAYGNKYWPRKYLIDIHGNVVYDHIGEGSYEETEEKIRELLTERAQVLGETLGRDTAEAVAPLTETPPIRANSPETYFGSLRNQNLGNGTQRMSGMQDFTLPATFISNTLYLKGRWDVQPEYAETTGVAGVVFTYDAAKVYMVASAETPLPVTVLLDGVPVKTIEIGDERLHVLVDGIESGPHLLELRSTDPGLKIYTFTFG